jgi:lipoprotein signal peptidase
MKKVILFLVLGLGTLGIDHLSKWWARANLYGKSAKQVWPNHFHFEWAENRGVAFSLFRNAPPWALVAVGLLALIFVGYLVLKAADTQKRLVAGLALIAGGAVGNLIDRVWHGYVVDFVAMGTDLRGAHHVWERWPTYNIADAALVIGVGLLFLDMAGQQTAAAEEAETQDQASQEQAGKRKRR